MLRVTQLFRAPPCPGQQTKTGYTGTRLAPALWQGREVSHCPCALPAPAPAAAEDQSSTDCLVGRSRASGGRAMAGPVGPAATMVLLSLAMGLEASPELSGEWGHMQGNKRC